MRLRIPLLGGLQQLSTGLLLAVLALAPSSSTSQAPSRTGWWRCTLRRCPRPLRTRSRSRTGETYLVAPGDDLWTVSERLLGDGGRWRELAEANPGKLDDPTSAAHSRHPAGRCPSSRASAPLTVRVRKGDTLSGLALEHLGAAGRWPRIAAANDDLIDDPDHIEIGWRLVVPGAEPGLPQRRAGTAAGMRRMSSEPVHREKPAAPPADPAPRSQSSVHAAGHR